MGTYLIWAVALPIILAVFLTALLLPSAAWLRELFPRPTRQALKFAGDVTYGVMGRYVRGIALVGLFDAFFIGLVLLFVLDPTLALPLILLTFVGAFLPVIGAFLSGVLSALVAFVAEDWKVALVVIVATIVVQQLDSHLFASRVYGKALDLPAAVVLFAIAIGPGHRGHRRGVPRDPGRGRPRGAATPAAVRRGGDRAEQGAGGGTAARVRGGSDTRTRGRHRSAARGGGRHRCAEGAAGRGRCYPRQGRRPSRRPEGRHRAQERRRTVLRPQFVMAVSTAVSPHGRRGSHPHHRVSVSLSTFPRRSSTVERTLTSAD